MGVAFHENDGNHGNDENDEDNSDSYKQEVESWISGNYGNHGDYENHGHPGCKPWVPKTKGLETPDLEIQQTKMKNSTQIRSAEPRDQQIAGWLDLKSLA